jgi:signal transduction histidine kinase
MHPPGRLGHARRLVVGFVAIAGGLTVALGLLAWRFVALEEQVDRQRVEQRLETVADGAASALDAGIVESERRLTAVLGADASERAALVADLPSDSVVLILTDSVLTAHPRSHLLYQPLPADTGPIGPALQEHFAPIDALEYRVRDLEGATAALGELARAGEPNVRAAALLRRARLFVRQGDPDAALATYDDLEALEGAWIEDLPAPLLAGYNRCELLASLDDPAGLEATAGALLTDLNSGRWHLTRAIHSFYVDKVARWLRPDAPAASVPRSAEALAEAVGALWRARDNPNGDQRANRPAKRSVIWAGDEPFVTLEARDDSARAVLVAGRQTVAGWTAAWERARERQGVELALVDLATGRPVLAAGPVGEPASPARPDQPPRVALSPAETGLPLTLSVTSTNPSADLAAMASRRTLLLVGLTLIVSILFAGVYFIGRAVNREFEVARVQSDFVAAVSHEFRSPLTSMRHLIELLAADRVPDEATRGRFYDVLGREAGRLQRLVEQLLDFRRLDEGKVTFDIRPIDAMPFVEKIAAEFRDDATAQRVTLEVSGNGSPVTIRADPDALGRAVWNLLENAVRYSSDCATVWLDVSHVDDTRLAISVRDRGVGIPPDEQASIFRKFVRGEAARRLGARGTGLGLAMVREIVRAHGGDVTVESEVGQGSTFTITLPVAEAVS